jgi:hypothetical protein
MRVFPVPGLPLRDPVKGDFVPDEGREVADSPYWRRRLLCQDASLSAPTTTPTSAQAAPVVIEDVTEVAPAQADDTPLATDDSDLAAADGDNAQ